MSAPRVVFLPASGGCGLTWINTACLCAMRPLCAREGVQVRIVLPAQEQNPGLKERLRCLYPPDDVVDVSEWSKRAGVVKSILAEKGPHVVHVQGVHDVRAVAPVKKSFGPRMPLVVTTNSFWNGKGTLRRTVAGVIQGWYYRRYVDYTIFQTSATADIFLASSRLLAAKRGGFIPLGVEQSIESFEAPVDAVGTPDLRPVVREGKYFVYLAGFTRNKGHRWLVEAIHPVLKSLPEWRVVFAGEGATRPAILRKVQSLGLEGRIICPGRIERQWVPWLLSRATGAIVGSQCETFGHCFVEPMAMGVPVIGTPTGAGKTLLQDFLTGFCIQHGDVDAFRKVFRYAVEHPDTMVRMGACAKKVVSAWTWEHVADAYLRLYWFLWRQSGMP